MKTLQAILATLIALYQSHRFGAKEEDSMKQSDSPQKIKHDNYFQTVFLHGNLADIFSVHATIILIPRVDLKH